MCSELQQGCYALFIGTSQIPTLRRILRHYEFSIPEEPLRRAEEQARFEKMKEVERSGQFAEPWLNPRNDAAKVRQGKIGGFMNDLTEEGIAYLNDIFSNPDS